MKLTIVVPADHPSLSGHFPGQPIAPGVLLLDMIAAEIRRAHSGARLMSIPVAKFHRAVKPGEAVDVTVDIETEAAKLRARFMAETQGLAVAEGSFLFQG